MRRDKVSHSTKSYQKKPLLCPEHHPHCLCKRQSLPAQTGKSSKAFPEGKACVREDNWHEYNQWWLSWWYTSAPLHWHSHMRELQQIIIEGFGWIVCKKRICDSHPGKRRQEIKSKGKSVLLRYMVPSISRATCLIFESESSITRV